LPAHRRYSHGIRYASSAADRRDEVVRAMFESSNNEPTPDSRDGDVETGAEVAGFTEALFHALIAMARRSKRGQADVVAALRGAGLSLDAPRVSIAVERLLDEGRVSTLVPLCDGGMLVTVASLSSPRTWLPPR
jgi:hypothetical protein